MEALTDPPPYNALAFAVERWFFQDSIQVYHNEHKIPWAKIWHPRWGMDPEISTSWMWNGSGEKPPRAITTQLTRYWLHANINAEWKENVQI